jgi:DNA-binding response OmpR family regulator
MAGSVLLVEDDFGIGAITQRYLQNAGHEVVWVRSGEEALVEFSRHAVTVVILDIGLPGMDGFDVCRELRRRSDVPVIMLTVRDEEPDRVAGFEVGADDYVTKPFSQRELVARMKAIQRRARGSVPAGHILTTADVELDTNAHDVRVNGVRVDLTAKEYELLQFLLQNPGIALSREKILERVWSMEFPGGTRTVDMHVAQLRRKLGVKDLIETVRGLGYRLSRQ